MFDSSVFGIMHTLAGLLLQPVVVALVLLSAWALVEVFTLITERVIGLKRWRESGQITALEKIAAARIERSDFLTRIAPMLGLMGTLIPLGPSLSALGEGDISVLTTAMSVAFDTTVLGLLVGIIGFIAGRLRRRWYDQLLQLMEQEVHR